ncbi:MAG TPA: AgmX/PglI C-terminal domain-containing protein [Polyangia bacterium]
MMRRDLRSALGIGLIFSVALGGAACAKKSAPAVPGSPEFDKKWADLAQDGIEVSYIEDDRGEGLMGNVRRASRVKADPPPPPPAEENAAGGLPAQPPGEQVQRIIRGNLMAVRGCFMSMARTGQARSGKAIVSFTIGADGRAAGLRVDAPSFADTPLPGCVTAQVSHWEFPKSQKGGGQVSYPFVFVGS